MKSNGVKICNLLGKANSSWHGSLAMVIAHWFLRITVKFSEPSETSLTEAIR